MIGLCLMAVAMLVSSRDLAPPIATTVAAIVGFGLVSYGVHVAWLVFYDREPDGPVQLIDRPSGWCGSVVHQPLPPSRRPRRAKNVPTTSSISSNPSAQKSTGW